MEGGKLTGNAVPLLVGAEADVFAEFAAVEFTASSVWLGVS